MGKKFDIIIDDGGHENHQIYNSLEFLFPEALAPGKGHYVLLYKYEGICFVLIFLVQYVVHIVTLPTSKFTYYSV